MAGTIREALREALDRPRTMLELSQLVRQPEKELAPHLEHLRRSLPAQGARLVVEPATCKSCGHVFEDRTRLTKPSRCPECKKERIEPPRFSVEEDSSA
jgi:predicted Zn-ribbon and HTH transcriptional regulator